MTGTTEGTTDTPEGATGELAATLEEWRSVMARQAIPDAPKDLLITDVDAWFLVAARVAMPRLVAAVEAGTRLADGWEKETERLDTLAGSTEDPLARAAVSMRAQAFEQCARELREAITSALTSTQSPVETVETPPTRQEAPDGR